MESIKREGRGEGRDVREEVSNLVERMVWSTVSLGGAGYT